MFSHSWKISKNGEHRDTTLPRGPWVPILPASCRPHGNFSSSHQDWHLTSKVSQPPNPCNWYLPLASMLTELEGEEKEPFMASVTRDRTNLQGPCCPHSPSPPQEQHTPPQEASVCLKLQATDLDSVPQRLRLTQRDCGNHSSHPRGLLHALSACAACSPGQALACRAFSMSSAVRPPSRRLVWW